MSELKMLRLSEVIEKLGIGRTNLYKLINHGSFPKPVKFDSRSRWPEHEVEEWLSERMAQR